jgi:hypothetical protein
MTAEQNKVLIQRLVEEAVNQRNLDVLAEVADGEFAQAARHWVGPFRAALCGNPASTADANGRASIGQ